MPELPEVETVVRTLEKQIQNDTIIDVDVRYAKIIDGDADEFSSVIKNKTFRNFKRRGKFLHFEFDSDSLYVHLRMEGKFYIVTDLDELDLKHVHVIFKMKSGRYLCYHDVRKFGRLTYVKDGETFKSIEKLGYEPWDVNLQAVILYKMLHNYTGNLKEFLLDQSKVCGIGNIYASEICFAVKLHPLKKTNTISKVKANELLEAIRRILETAIKAGGTTIRSYTSSLGVTGLFQLEVNVYGKEGEACPICETPIKKVVIGGRSSFYCPKCQRR